jgi:hypothetical protein
LKKQQATQEIPNMKDGEQDEASPPLAISPPVSPIPRPAQSDDEEVVAKRFIDKFKSDRSSQLLESKFNQRRIEDRQTNGGDMFLKIGSICMKPACSR